MYKSKPEEKTTRPSFRMYRVNGSFSSRYLNEGNRNFFTSHPHFSGNIRIVYPNSLLGRRSRAQLLLSQHHVDRSLNAKTRRYGTEFERYPVGSLTRVSTTEVDGRTGYNDRFGDITHTHIMNAS